MDNLIQMNFITYAPMFLILRGRIRRTEKKLESFLHRKTKMCQLHHPKRDCATDQSVFPLKLTIKKTGSRS